MRRVLDAAAMGEADRATVSQRGVPELLLMESAAAAVTRKLFETCTDPESERVVVLCGKGNNGGDGLAVARQLLLRAPDLALRTVLLAEPEALRGAAAANWEALAGQGHVADVVPDETAWQALLPAIADATMVVDAILGTGTQGPARGLAARAIADVNAGFGAAKVLAVDLPSGLGSDSADPPGDSMRADWTVTFSAPKVCHALPPACERVGELSVARIGTAEEVLDTLPGPRLLLGEASDARELLEPRARSAHKGSFGHVLAIGGSRSKPGAILMAGKAALRAGAGLVTVATSAGAAAALLEAAPELMLEPADEQEDGTLAGNCFRAEWLESKSAVAIGPGLGRSDAGRELVRAVAEACRVPLVIDADGLAGLPPGLARERPAATVLTPHPGEMAQLAGIDTAAVQADRLGTAREYAVREGVHLVLKGQRSLTASPDGDVIVNPTGTPGMATAGSGDILTGMVAAYLGQFPERPAAATVAAAVYLHGLAGELAADELGEQAMLATDIARCLPAATKALQL